MNLTTAQKTTLATDINGQGSLASARTIHDAAAVCAFYTTAGTTTIWRNNVATSEIVAACIGTEVAALTAVKQGALNFLMTPPIIDASSVNVRNDFSAIFAAGTTFTNLTAISSRTATKIEQLFGSGGPPITAALDANGVSLCTQVLDVATVGSAMGWF
jgi:hypothetical protein